MGVEVSYKPGTLGRLFFTLVNCGKGVVCQDRAFWGLDGESAGGNGRAVTLVLAGGVWFCGCLWCM